MPTIENASVAGTVAVVGLGTTLFTSFMPGMSDLRIADVTADNSTQVRHAEMMGAATTILFAAVIAWWAKSPIPVLAGVVTIVALSITYEISLMKGSQT
jgi:hypothetical protein